MDQSISVAQFQEKLLELAQPLTPLDLPLLDAHGATLSSNLMVDDQLLLKTGDRIGATQIGLAASLGLDRLPCRPHPRSQRLRRRSSRCRQRRAAPTDQQRAPAAAAH